MSFICLTYWINCQYGKITKRNKLNAYTLILYFFEQKINVFITINCLFNMAMDNGAMQLLTGAQIRMARGLLRWSIKDLADHAGIGTTTVRKLEKEDGIAKDVRLPLNEAVKDAFLATGKLTFEGDTCVCVKDS